MIRQLAKLLNEAHKEERGFTLIELLVVVIILGILAAIAIPTFLNQRVQGYNASAQSDLRNAGTFQQAYRTINGSYTGEVNVLEDQGLRGTDGVDLQIPESGATYCMQASHLNGNKTYRITNSSGTVVEGTCGGGEADGGSGGGSGGGSESDGSGDSGNAEDSGSDGDDSGSSGDSGGSGGSGDSGGEDSGSGSGSSGDSGGSSGDTSGSGDSSGSGGGASDSGGISDDCGNGKGKGGSSSKGKGKGGGC